MAGIYIHIPWCRKVCIYCDFHFTVSMRNKDKLLQCILKEAELQKNYTGNEIIDTIYLGGGTPSVLSPEELEMILGKINAIFSISEKAEITIETNPDDLNPRYLKELKDTGINRLSIGIQSFFDDDLNWMNRRHDSKQAKRCIENSRKAGFENIGIDLIYGVPGMTGGKWKENLEIAFKHEVQHLSAYHLTLESKTVYAYMIRKGVMKEPDEAGGMEQFNLLMEKAAKKGYIHYEISNFSLPGYFSVHNTSYWRQKSYLGLGPSANSFNRFSRQWNVRNNSLYIEKISEGIIPCSREELTLTDRYNEYILTSLRTMWGIEPKHIEKLFGDKYAIYCNEKAAPLLKQGKMEIYGRNEIRLSRAGKFFADGIISELFWID